MALLLSFVLLLLVLFFDRSTAGEITLGTTLVAIRFPNGVVVGADSRTSQGDYVSNRWAHKVVRSTPFVCVARSGSAAATQALLQALETEEYGEQLDVKQVAFCLRQAVVKKPDSVGLLVAGIDRHELKPHLYCIAPTGALVEEPGKFACSGSGSSFASAYLDDCYWDDTEDLEDQAIEHCRRAIEHAVHRDKSSGGLIRMHVVRSDGTGQEQVFSIRSPKRVKSEVVGFAEPQRCPFPMVKKTRDVL